MNRKYLLLSAPILACLLLTTPKIGHALEENVTCSPQKKLKVSAKTGSYQTSTVNEMLKRAVVKARANCGDKPIIVVKPANRVLLVKPTANPAENYFVTELNLSYCCK